MNPPASRKRPAAVGLDAWLQRRGATLRTGEQIQLRLVKGKSVQVIADPVDPKAEPEEFPAILKFPISTVTPDFTSHPWNTSRLYQQDVPKHEDSDEELEQPQQEKRKRRRGYATQRQWVLQTAEEFLECMVQKHEGGSTVDARQEALSSRYEGTPEHNPSHFVLFCLDDATSTIRVQPLPSPTATVTFCQPLVRSGAAQSLSQAEEAAHRGRPPRIKSKLLEKLQQHSGSVQIDEGDDVMADVKYTNRKGGGGARRELLETMADGIAVSDDGVLGGTNDSAFGARNQRFGKMQANEIKGQTGGAGTTTERGADGAAMADDFYARDVGKEFEEMDYDPNEGEFDDDDVDIGESEIHGVGDDGGGGDLEDDDIEEEEEEDAREAVLEGAAGLASANGFKMMLAKARGEAPAEPVEVQGDTGSKNRSARDSTDGARDHRMKFRNATQEKKKPAANNNTGSSTPQDPTGVPVATVPSSSSLEVHTDENGLRVITQDSVRREIWLNHGSISIVQLSKIFSIRSKVPNKDERKAKFREAVKELCTMEKDPVKGQLLVLKQHYAHMD